MWKRSPRSRQHSVNNQNTHGEASGNTGRKERVYFYLDMRFWFWTGLLVAGFAYVAFVLCDRSVPLQSRDGGYAEVIKLLLSAPLLYMLGVRRTLEPFDSDWRSVVVRNVIGFALPFFVALHWYYLQSIPQLNYSLTLKGLQTMHPIGQLVFLAGGLLVAGLVVYHLVLARREGYLGLYAAALVGAVGVLAVVSLVLQEQYSVYIHHYFLFGFFIPFARFRNPVSMVCQAVCAGGYVEGVSEWGMATLWYPR